MTMLDQWDAFLDRCEGLKTSYLSQHALVGRICGCMDCFCCAARETVDTRRERARQIRHEEMHRGFALRNARQDGNAAEAARQEREIDKLKLELREIEA